MKRSNIHLQYNAPVTLTFFFLSLASLALGHLTNGWTTHHLFSVLSSRPRWRSATAAAPC